MELRQVRYFVAVAEGLNFTRAAARLRVAQPALSRQVRMLEEELGVQLFRRSPRGVVLTAGGRQFLEDSRSLLAFAGEATERVRAVARGESGELRIGYAPSPTVEILPPAVQGFQRAVPGVRLVLQDLAGDEMAEGLRSGALDFGLMLRPTAGMAAGLEWEVLRQYPLHVVLPPGHPWARRRVVPLGDLAGAGLVVLRRRDYSDYNRLLGEVLAPVKVKPRIVAECDSGTSLFTEVQAGRGVALLPDVFRKAIAGRLVLRPLDPVPATFDIVLAWAAKGERPPAAEKFRRAIRRAAGVGR